MALITFFTDKDDQRVKTLSKLPMQRVWVRSLMEELRSHMLPGQKKIIKKDYMP